MILLDRVVFCCSTKIASSVDVISSYVAKVLACPFDELVLH